MSPGGGLSASGDGRDEVAEDFSRLTVRKLKERLRKLGIQPRGRKADLIEQLREASVEREEARDDAQPETESEFGHEDNPAQNDDDEGEAEEQAQKERTQARSLSPTPRERTEGAPLIVDKSLRKIAVLIPFKSKSKKPRLHTITFDCSSPTVQQDVLRSIEGLLASNGFRFKHYYLQNATGEVQVLSPCYLEHAPVSACPTMPRDFCFHVRVGPVRNFHFARSFLIWTRCVGIALFVSASVYMAGLLLFGKGTWHYHIETFIFQGDSTGGYFIGRLAFSLLEMRTGCDLHPASASPCIGFMQPYVMYPLLWMCIYIPCIYLVSRALVTLAPLRWIFTAYDRQLFAVERSQLSAKSATAAQKRAKTALNAQKSWKRPATPQAQDGLSEENLVAVVPPKGSMLSLQARVAYLIAKKHLLAAWIKPAVASWPNHSASHFAIYIFIMYALRLLNASPSTVTALAVLLPASCAAVLHADRLRFFAEEIRGTSWMRIVRDVATSCPPQGWLKDLSVVARDSSHVSLAFRTPSCQPIHCSSIRFGMPVKSFIVEAQSEFSGGAWKQLRGAHGSSLQLNLATSSGSISQQAAAFFLFVFSPIAFLTTLAYAPRSWYFSRDAYLFGVSIYAIGALVAIVASAKYARRLLASMSSSQVAAADVMTVTVTLPVANAKYKLRVRPQDVFGRKTAIFEGSSHSIDVTTLPEQRRAVVVFSNERTVRACSLRWDPSSATSFEWFRTSCAALVDTVPNDDSFFHLLTGGTSYMPPEWLETCMFLPDTWRKHSPLKLGSGNQVTPSAAYRILSDSALGEARTSGDDLVPIVALQPVNWTTKRPRKQRGLHDSPFLSLVYIFAVVAGRILHLGLFHGAQKLAMDVLAGVFISSFLVLINAAVDGRIVPWRRPTDVL